MNRNLSVLIVINFLLKPSLQVYTQNRALCLEHFLYTGTKAIKTQGCFLSCLSVMFNQCFMDRKEAVGL